MGYEIDFLPVGDGERSGEAIALRYGNLLGARNEQKVLVIDGGTKESGDKLVNHIETHYKTDIVDLVVSTHPDADHSSGLSAVLEELKVKELWMHRPWEHSDEYRELFKDARITESSLEKRLVASLQNASDLEGLASRKGIPIIEPFSDAGITHDHIIILGPTEFFYGSQLANFRATPLPKEEISIVGRVTTRIVETGKEVMEKWGIETLTDPSDDETSAENNSSVIFLLKYGGEFFLFSGDAGTASLSEAADFAQTLNIDFNLAKFVQMPHHGSRHNVGPTILNRIIGPKLPNPDDEATKTAFVSVAPKDDKHPSKKVANAFKRRGATVFETRLKPMLHRKDAPDRGWQNAVSLPFYDQVEE